MQDALKLFQGRQSDRIPFDPERPIAKQDLRQILEAGRWAPTAHNMQNFEIDVVDDKKLLQAIGDVERPISDAFIEENYRQLSFSEEELLRKKVGLLATMFPPAWRAPRVKQDDAGNREEISRPFPSCPVLLVVVYDPRKRAPASKGDFLGIMSLGCLMENMWLMAHSLGIGFHVMSALSADIVEKEVKRILDIPQYLKIAFAVRLGYPLSTPPRYLRVRREVEDFTHHNRFGNPGLDEKTQE
jgi:nitroreductase